MAVLFVLIAMTHQGDVAAMAKLLQQAKRKFLAMILDAFVCPIKVAAAVKEFAAIAASEFQPSDIANPKRLEQLLAGSETCHPFVIPRFQHPTAAVTCCQDAESIFLMVNGRMH